MRTALALSLCSLVALGACSNAGNAPDRVTDASHDYTVPEEPGLRVGDRAPELTLVTEDNTRVDLADLYADGPVVLTFYRGGWCPYCNNALSAWQDKIAALSDAGGTFVALTPEKPSNVLATKSKNHLDYTVLSDTTGDAARAFKVQFRLDDATIEKYRGYGIDLEASNAEGAWTLPAPATFVIDTDGVVRWVWADWDYTERADPDEVIEAVKRVG